MFSIFTIPFANTAANVPVVGLINQLSNLKLYLLYDSNLTFILTPYLLLFVLFLNSTVLVEVTFPFFFLNIVSYVLGYLARSSDNAERTVISEGF